MTQLLKTMRAILNLPKAAAMQHQCFGMGCRR